MNTQILGEKTEDIQLAAEILQAGGLVAFPTETVYGLGADALNPEAVKKVYLAKGRPSDNPMIVHISSKDDLNKLTDEITEDTLAITEKFWPGPLTVVVKANTSVPRVTTGGLETVAVRMPNQETALKLIAKSGCPIAAPSANLSGKPSPTKAVHVIEDLKGRVDAIIEGDDCLVGIESTVVDMTGPTPMILRPGIITREALEEALGKTVETDRALLGGKPGSAKDAEGKQEDFQPKSPGMKYKHYAPEAEMVIYRGEREKVALAIAEEKMKRLKAGQKVEVIVFAEDKPLEAAHEFFGRLRACDKKDADVILAAALNEDGIGFAVMNRMFKSAGYNIIEIE